MSFTSSPRLWLFLAGLNGALAVAGGAYGAHAEFVDAASREIFSTAVQFQMWHALALLGVACLIGRTSPAANKLFHLSASLFCIGIILFCGTLYLLGLSGPRLFPGSAPTGGMALIAGWVLLAIGGVISHKKPGP